MSQAPETETSETSKNAAAPPGEGRLSETDRLNAALGAARRALRAVGQPEKSAAALRLASHDMSTPRIVVVGETKRGKSSLVNMLVGRPGLSPVDADESTMVHLFVRALDEEHPQPQGVVRVATGGIAGGQDRQIGLDDVGSHVRQGHTPEGTPISSVRAFLDLPLPAVEVVDTPGVGGIGGARGELHRRLMNRSGGLLILVMDAGSPMARPELQHLTAWSGAQDRLAIAVTMTDKYPASAEEMVAHVREQLGDVSSHLGRAPVVGVSSKLAEAALTQPPGPIRDALWTKSGLPQITALIEETYEQRASIPPRNALRYARNELVRSLRALRLQQEVLAGTDEADDRLTELEGQVQEHNAGASRWNLDLDRDFARLRRSTIRELQRRMDEYADDARRRIAAIPLTRTRPHVDALVADLSAEYALIVSDVELKVESGLAQIVRGLVEDAADDILQAAPWTEPTEALVSMDRSNRRLMDPSMILGVFGGARSAAFGPAGVVLAAISVAMQFGFRGHLLDKAQLTQEFNQAVVSGKTDIITSFDERLSEIKPELIVTYRALLKERQDRLAKLLAEARTTKAAGMEAQRARTKQLQDGEVPIRRAIKAIDDALAG